MIKDKLLFTPGPLTTSYTVKSVMLRDLGSRDHEFIDTVKSVRSDLLELAGVSKREGYEAVLMQGSGTFGIESVISSVVPDDGHILIIINGAYGERISKMAKVHHIEQTRMVFEEDEQPSLSRIEQELQRNSIITHVAVIHCETTTGIINPVEEIGALVKRYGKTFIVDAMSSFGAVPVNVKEAGIDFLVSSSNKCIEGVPGFSFTIAGHDALMRAKGIARTLALDLYAQWEGLEKDGQFRFTPPTHAILAFRQAIDELKKEGGVSGRAGRYSRNHQQLVKGMRRLGFKEYLPVEKQGYIITSFHYPEDPRFDFKEFYNRLNDENQVIYPGKLSKVDCFRIGNIGQIYPEDIDVLLNCIEKVLKDMEIS
ncbi:MAG: 2-aminoethylphosphonate--pyruvate transaminase [Mangrovibacterium sp.]